MVSEYSSDSQGEQFLSNIRLYEVIKLRKNEAKTAPITLQVLM
jgi:hypothetical protein